MIRPPRGPVPSNALRVRRAIRALSQNVSQGTVGSGSTPRRNHQVNQAGLREVPHVVKDDRREYAARLLKPVGTKETEDESAKHLSYQSPEGHLSEVH